MNFHHLGPNPEFEELISDIAKARKVKPKVVVDALARQVGQELQANGLSVIDPRNTDQIDWAITAVIRTIHQVCRKYDFPKTGPLLNRMESQLAKFFEQIRR